jgi:hypothetical protein
MATRQSTSNTRARRNRSGPSAGAHHKRGNKTGCVASKAVRRHNFDGDLARVLQGERGRLSEAQSVLGCLHLALLHTDDIRVKDPDYATAAGIALALVREAANHLDAARLQPLVDALGSLSTCVKSTTR